MDAYAIYMHNEMVLMVAKGNPKAIKGIRIWSAPTFVPLPNPVNERVIQFYGRKVLERYGMWPKITAGKECFPARRRPTTGLPRFITAKPPTGYATANQTLASLENGGHAGQARRRCRGQRQPAAGRQPVRRSAYAIGMLSGSPHKAAAEHTGISGQPRGARRLRQFSVRRSERRRTQAQADSLICDSAFNRAGRRALGGA